VIADIDRREFSIQARTSDRFPADIETVVDVIKRGSFPTSEALGPSGPGQSLRVAGVIAIHRAMVIFPSQPRRRIAIRLPQRVK
jgi:hypothetical protein